VDHPDLGTRKLARLEENLAAAALELLPRAMERLIDR
jgi:aryl-alcohol dehydrogenase-like predicted oxidoreductase